MSILLASTTFKKIIIILLCLLVDTCNFSLLSPTACIGNYEWINLSLVFLFFHFSYTVTYQRYISTYHHVILFWVNPLNFVADAKRKNMHALTNLLLRKSVLKRIRFVSSLQMLYTTKFQKLMSLKLKIY